jgi:3-hydroxymyristoyl/3-hydroxydecanoyl-(acyl carrier protein) dehydratase
MEYSESELTFTASEPFFRGHYPGHPVTPGVMLLDRAVSEARRIAGRSFVLKGVRKVKFSRPVLPDEPVSLRLERRGEGEISYSFTKDGMSCASGILVFDQVRTE